jgi:WD40 repeat protein
MGILKGDPTPLSSVAFSPDGKTVVSGHQDGGIRFWNVAPLLPDSAK